MKKYYYRIILCFLVGVFLPIRTVHGEEPSGQKIPVFSFSGSNSVVSKYIARGWRLTDGWSMQPSGTVSFKGFSLNVWGNMDLTAVNEGDALFLAENPSAGSAGSNGLKGRFSETDFSFSYSREVKKVSLTGGVKSYVYPERAVLFPSSTEVFGGLTAVTLPLKPTATLYVDVDETGDLGNTGYYLELSARHSLAIPHKRFSSLDLYGTFTFADRGFARYYYGTSYSRDGRPLRGPHDFSILATLPCKLSDSLTVSFFGAFSGLMGSYRTVQYPNARDVYLHREASPTSRANTPWGGLTLSVSF